MRNLSKMCSKCWNCGLDPQSLVENQCSQPLPCVASVGMPVVLKASSLFPISQQLINSSSGSGETSLKKLFHWLSRENTCLPLLPFLSTSPVCVCRVLRWLWKKHMELWYEHNGQGLMLIFFSTLVHSTKSERFHLVPLLHICCFNSEVLGFI